LILWSRGEESHLDEDQLELAQLHDYRPAGIALTTVGGGLAAAAGLLFWLDASAVPQPAARGTTGPGVSSFIFTMRGWF
jgi:hypothetical protein